MEAARPPLRPKWTATTSTTQHEQFGGDFVDIVLHVPGRNRNHGKHRESARRDDELLKPFVLHRTSLKHASIAVVREAEGHRVRCSGGNGQQVSRCARLGPLA